MNTLKICHICAAIQGATWMVEQLRELRDRFGYDVYAVVISEDCDFAKRLREVGVKCLPLNSGYQSIKEMLLIPIKIFQMAILLRRERFDVVQTHLFPSMVIGRIASWLADVPVRLAMVASPFHLEAHTSRLIDRATAWMETGVIASCVNTVELYEEIGVPAEKISLIYYGPDERKFNPVEILPADIRAEFGWSADTPVVSLVAYFYPEMPKSSWIPKIAFGRAVKGHEDFVEAARIVLRKFPKTKFLMVGPGWYEEGEKYQRKIIELVKSLNLEKEIIFTGYRADVNGILRSVNVAVQASIIENLGGTVEALLMERPLVATRVGGIPDSVRDGHTGILVEPSNVEDLARGILQMLANPQEAEQMARNGRSLMLERFSLSRTVNDLHELYQKLSKNKKRSGYRLPVSFYRIVAAIPVYVYLSFRVIFVEYILRIYAPLYLMRIRALVHILFWKLAAVVFYARRLVFSVFKKTGLENKRVKDK